METKVTPNSRWRTILFVPADRLDRYPKAMATGADAVCVDLEDGVGFGAKEVARQAAVTLLGERLETSAVLVLRINDPKTGPGKADIAALNTAGVRPDVIMLPKVDGDEEMTTTITAFGPRLFEIPVVAQIETARGLSKAIQIASASKQVVALFFGAVDLSADIGCVPDWEPMLYARSHVLAAAAAAGIVAIDSPFMNVAETEALVEESRRARRLGFAGKAAIHPTQVGLIQQAFSPTAEEISWARKIVAAYEANGGGVLLVDGQLIERPVVRAALGTLASGTSELDPSVESA